MRKYLAELHKKSDHHKKQFAFLASGTITLFIFGVWSLSTFGMNEEVIVKGDGLSTGSKVAESEVSPFQSFRSNLASSLEALRNNFDELKRGFKTINLETEYTEMRNGALNIYGQ
ncbi:MAG: hypothetical protein Q7R89_00105 [bacterium]|nr:hypothetical protein [bacterium]